MMSDKYNSILTAINDALGVHKKYFNIGIIETLVDDGDLFSVLVEISPKADIEMEDAYVCCAPALLQFDVAEGEPVLILGEDDECSITFGQIYASLFWSAAVMCKSEEDELERLRAQVAELEDQKEAVIQQAQIWRQEARTMRNIVAECYQAVTGSAGEPGDWNGAKPVREAISELKGGRDKIESALKKMISMYIIDDYICGEDRENKIKDIFRRMMEESKS